MVNLNSKSMKKFLLSFHFEFSALPQAAVTASVPSIGSVTSKINANRASGGASHLATVSSIAITQNPILSSLSSTASELASRASAAVATAVAAAQQQSAKEAAEALKKQAAAALAAKESDQKPDAKEGESKDARFIVVVIESLLNY
jgi:hypothetical protein